MSKPNAIAVMSVGRLGFTANFNCVLISMGGAGVAINIRPGQFWEQHIQNAISEHSTGKYDYIIAVDFDTLFVTEDVLALLKLMDEHPEADAICATQIRRECDTLLIGEFGQTQGGVKEADYSGELTKLRRAHLGLTIFRAKRFRELPKPWFVAIPGQNGEWDSGRQEADGYFWNKWREYDFTLYQANRIRIGHLQMLATWPGKDFRAIHQYMNDWRTKGKPKDVQELCS